MIMLTNIFTCLRIATMDAYFQVCFCMIVIQQSHIQTHLLIYSTKIYPINYVLGTLLSIKKITLNKIHMPHILQERTLTNLLVLEAFSAAALIC